MRFLARIAINVEDNVPEWHEDGTGSGINAMNHRSETFGNIDPRTVIPIKYSIKDKMRDSPDISLPIKN